MLNPTAGPDLPLQHQIGERGARVCVARAVCWGDRVVEPCSPKPCPVRPSGLPQVVAFSVRGHQKRNQVFVGPLPFEVIARPLRARAGALAGERTKSSAEGLKAQQQPLEQQQLVRIAREPLGSLVHHIDRAQGN